MEPQGSACSTSSLHSVVEASQRLGVKETTVKKLIREGELLSVKIGDRRLVPNSAIDTYIDRLVADAQASTPASPMPSRLPSRSHRPQQTEA